MPNGLRYKTQTQLRGSNAPLRAIGSADGGISHQLGHRRDLVEQSGGSIRTSARIDANRGAEGA